MSERDSAIVTTALATPAVEPPTLGEATRLWLKIGCLSFGGPAAQIALMHRLLIDEKRWIDEPRFLHALNFCMLLPGPEAQQLAVYLGWLLHRLPGGLIAGALFILPGATVMMGLSILYAFYNQIPLVDGLFYGISCAVLAIVIEALLRIGRRALKHRVLYIVAGLAFCAIFFFNIPFPLVVLFAGGAGAIGAGAIGAVACPQIFAPHTRANDASGTPATAIAATADTRRRRPTATAIILCAGAALWFTPTAIAALVFGNGSVFTDIGLFFSKMAVVTFGGAYAVLAYVAQQAVDVYGWLAADEMLTGLGLAETTPGPLIMVVQFVGFLGAFRNPAPFEPLFAGLIGGVLATWVTFVPSFLWIFLGAPYVERLRGARRLVGALTAITAAVVGVILNLTVWFALHVLFGKIDEVTIGPLRLFIPDPISLDGFALVVAVAAAVAMLRFHVGLIPTLLASAAAGISYRLLSAVS